MSKLIKNEFKKIFGKKLIYILFILAIGFVTLINTSYNIDYSMDEAEYLKAELSFLEEELNTLDYKLKEDNEYYIELKTQYDLIKLKLNYEPKSWQYIFIESNDAIYNNLRSINENIYGFDKDDGKLQLAQFEFNNIKQKLDSGDWQGFIQNQLNNTKNEIAFYEDTLSTTKDKKVIEETKNVLESLKINEKALEWRLEKQIPYEYSFLSNKIDAYENNAQTVLYLKDKENKTKEKETFYNESLKIMNESKYYVENNINIENEYDARYLLGNLMKEYGMFISIFSIIIAGTIVSNEFQKGTIKLLLTKPFSRAKILLAKYVVSIISIFIFIIIFGLLQYFIGGLVSGFDVFKTPMVNYDLNTNSIVTMSAFEYLMLNVLTSLPIYIFTSTLSFALSTIAMNSAIAIALPILLNMLSVTINLFVDRFKVLKYFITANWDLSIYLFGGSGLAEGLNMLTSLVISAIYIVIILAITFVVFNKKDIKNV